MAKAITLSKPRSLEMCVHRPSTLTFGAAMNRLLLGVVAAIVILWIFRQKKDKRTVYGLQHGRLHLDTRIPMWMNMGYWKVSKTLSR